MDDELSVANIFYTGRTIVLVPSITSLSYIVMIPHRLISEHMMESEGENEVKTRDFTQMKAFPHSNVLLYLPMSDSNCFSDTISGEVSGYG